MKIIIEKKNKNQIKFYKDKFVGINFNDVKASIKLKQKNFKL